MFMRKLARAVREGMDRWLFRIRGPEPAPIVLKQRRIFVLPTSAGFGLAGALLIMLIASINYNLSLGYGLVFLVGGVAVASIVHAFRNLLHLSLTPGRVDPVFAGQRARFQLLVHNPRAMRRPALRLKARSATTEFELPPDSTTAVTLDCPTVQRGWLPVGRLIIETTWPLGLIRAWSVVVPDLQCLVYPTPERAPPAPPGRAASDSLGIRPSPAGDDDFAGLRTYQRADSPRHVAWKTVARGGPMMTKQFAGLEGGELELDWSSLPAQLGIEARLARLAAWVQAANGAGTRYSLQLPSVRVPAASGAQHAHACLKQLALF